jgi:NADH-quinone oxidoreductase subunit J
MSWLFYLAAGVAVVSTAMVITRRNAVHALLYLVVSFLAVAVVFFLLGAPFIAALEVIIYAGAIMVLFVFVVMMVQVGGGQEKTPWWSNLRAWIGPVFLSLVLFGEYLFVLSSHGGGLVFQTAEIPPKAVGLSLFKTYLLGVELAGMLLLAAVIGAYHLGRLKQKPVHRFFTGEGEKT